MQLTQAFAIGAFLATAVKGHIAMTQPVPYGHPDTSPLNPSGSNYPCKTDNGFTVNSITNLTMGKSQTLAFTGTAVHNGGSCQLSLTPGYTPTTDSAFKVIYSIEGGCPGVNGATNTYQFSVPSDVPNGDYSLAWTWYNNIGNREIYMNCAPVTISGSSGTQSSFNALPDMAIFNIPSKNTCGTIETFDVQFPDPGKYLTTGSGFKPTPPSNCGSKAVATGGAGGDTGAPPSSAAGGAPAPASAAAASSSPAPNAGQPVTATSFLTYTSTSTVGAGAAPSGGVFGENPASGSSVAAATSAAVATSILASAAPAAPAASGSAATPAGVMSTMSCATNGALMCSPDGTLQGLCNFGSAMMMPVAAGTKCVNGSIMKRSAKFVVGY